jgi:hypothetical protein
MVQDYYHQRGWEAQWNNQGREVSRIGPCRSLSGFTFYKENERCQL